MIVDKEKMILIEKKSKKDVLDLMEDAGQALTKEIQRLSKPKDNILFLVGKGNNGGDALVIARSLKNRNIKICLIEDEIKTNASKINYELLDKSLFIKKKDLKKYINDADIIIDGVYGFSYHGQLKKEIADIFKLVNNSKAKVYSIDINSGCEALGYCDNNSIKSDITFVLDAYKPFHMLRKNHLRFNKMQLLDLKLPHNIKTNFLELDEEKFFNIFPKSKINSYKGTYGKTALIGGSYGMAGALMLNIIGAKSLGVKYLNIFLDESIYPIVARKFLTPVYQIINQDNYKDINISKDIKAIGIGSGINNLSYKKELLSKILKKNITTIVDAQAIRLLKDIKHNNKHLIITPHIGEFSYLINKPKEEIEKRLIEYALEYAKKNKVIVVLKSPNTIGVSPKNEIYINQSGNESLGTAGSGDILTGIISTMNCFIDDSFLATSMAVFFHGLIADYAAIKNSKQLFDLEKFPIYANRLFKKYGY